MTRQTSITATCTSTSDFHLKEFEVGGRKILTMRESVGVPEDVSAKSPMIERKRIPIAKVQFRFENGMRTTIIDGEIIDICHFL